jgi:hypothetical protein
MKISIVALFCFLSLSLSLSAQKNISGEQYGKTFNIGLGVGGYSGYYGYIGRSVPVVTLNYEIDVAKSFTLAPFIGIYSFSNRYYWGDNNRNYPYRNYTYRETVIPIGLKATYYFDDLLQAGSDWDFYLAGSVGYAIVNTRWDNDYYGDKDYYKRGNPLFLDLHIGAEYHFNSHIGAFLDLSTGVSTVGLAIH